MTKRPLPSAERDIAAAVHETTNALTVILGWIERARAASARESEVGQALVRAARYARAARDQMRRSIGAEIPPLPPEPAAHLTARLCEDLAAEAQERGIKLCHHVQPDAAPIGVIHPHAAWRVLTNLVLNALALGPSGSRVQVTTSADDDFLRFVVRDEGPGVPPELRASLFHAPQSRRRGGAGIGLRHSHALAAELGGNLTLLDSPLGAAFELTWPATEPVTAEPPPASSRSGERGLQGARVLLLEDDAAITELLELSLGARGAQITAVTTSDALYQALKEAPDVVLMDLSPLDGQLDAAVNRARQCNPNVSCIVVSGSVTTQPRDDVLWVRKPFEPRELVAAILREREKSE